MKQLESIFKIAKRKTQSITQDNNIPLKEHQTVKATVIEKFERDNTLKINMIYRKEKQR